LAFSILADPLMVLAAAAQRTHLLHNPVKIVISRYCRLIIVIARGPLKRLHGLCSCAPMPG
jgi:hypothetical protein